jgi:hypothetical protein
LQGIQEFLKELVEHPNATEPDSRAVDPLSDEILKLTLNSKDKVKSINLNQNPPTTAEFLVLYLKGTIADITKHTCFINI